MVTKALSDHVTWLDTLFRHFIDSHEGEELTPEMFIEYLCEHGLFEWNTDRMGLFVNHDGEPIICVEMLTRKDGF